MENTPIRNLTDSPLLDDRNPSSPIVSLMLLILVGVMVFLLIFVSSIGVCMVKQSSMVPTLRENDHVLTVKYPVSVKPGDIVILDASNFVSDASGEPVLFIKRVVGVGGDTLIFKLDTEPGQTPTYNTKVLLFRIPKNADAREPVEPYVKDEAYSMVYNARFDGFVFDENGECFINVPPQSIYVLGDNRNVSNDSRAYGSFGLDKVKGKMFYKLEKGSLLEALFKFFYRSSAQNI